MLGNCFRPSQSDDQYHTSTPDFSVLLIKFTKKISTILVMVSQARAEMVFVFKNIQEMILLVVMLMHYLYSQYIYAFGGRWQVCRTTWLVFLGNYWQDQEHLDSVLKITRATCMLGRRTTILLGQLDSSHCKLLFCRLQFSNFSNEVRLIRH